MPHEELVERAKYEPLRSTPLDPVAEALETMPYGLYIIGSRSAQGVPNGMMADWTMQVSFNPRLVCVSFENDATTLRNVRETSVLTVNVLPSDAGALAAKFAQPADASKIKGRSEQAAAVIYDKLRDVAHHAGEHTGCPVLDEALAYLECRVREFVPASDHTLVLAEVVAGAILREGEALTQRMLGWSYGG